MNCFDGLPERTAEAFEIEAKRIRNTKYAGSMTIFVSFHELAENKNFFVQKLEAAGICKRDSRQSIYCIALDQGALVDQVRAEFAKIRKLSEDGISDDRKAFSKLNEPKGGHYLYVGSSKKIQHRLMEHLGYGSSGKTYALHMNSWARSLMGGIEISVVYFNQVERTVLLSLEDQLAQELMPIAGRRGIA